MAGLCPSRCPIGRRTDNTSEDIHPPFAGIQLTPRQSRPPQKFDKSISSVAADFRNLAPLVVAQALATAGTLVCEPISRYRIEAPADALGGLLATLARSGAALTESSVVDGVGVLEGTISAAHIHAVQQALPGLTGGAGSMESAFERYVPVTDTPPTRQRIGANPFRAKMREGSAATIALYWSVPTGPV